MKRSCCGVASPREAEREHVSDRVMRPHSFTRRCLGLAEWLLPGAGLALIPKCPACVAAYLAIGTGIGISTAVAGYLRTFLIIACSAALCFAAGKRARRFAAAARDLVSAASSP